MQCECAGHALSMAATSIEQAVDPTLNPQVAGLRVSKTMALTDLARSMREAGKDVIGLAAGEPDFDTPAPIVEAGIEALRCVPLIAYESSVPLPGCRGARTLPSARWWGP